MIRPYLLVWFPEKTVRIEHSELRGFRVAGVGGVPKEAVFIPRQRGREAMWVKAQLPPTPGRHMVWGGGWGGGRGKAEKPSGPAKEGLVCLDGTSGFVLRAVGSHGMFLSWGMTHPMLVTSQRKNEKRQMV